MEKAETEQNVNWWLQNYLYEVKVEATSLFY